MILSNPFIVDPRVHNEAKTLVDNGHKVTVIVWDRHNIYKDEEIIDGIRIIRVHNIKIMKNLKSDLIRNPIWWRIAYKKAVFLYRNGLKFDVVHCHDLDTLPAGVLLKKRFGIRLVYDAHEIFGNMIARTMPKIIVKIAFYLEKLLVKHVDNIITVNEPLLNYFRSISSKEITIVMNLKELIIDRYSPTNNEIFTLLYIGVLHRSRMFPELVDIIGEIDNVKLIVAGKKENIFDEVKQRSKRYSNVEFIGSISYDKVLKFTLSADVVLCMINPEDLNNRIALANKQFEAMVCGRPIICTKGTLSGKITEKEKCGLVVEYKKNALKEAIIKLRDNPKICEELGKNALKAAIDKYNWELEEKKLIMLYNKIDEKK